MAFRAGLALVAACSLSCCLPVALAAEEELALDGSFEGLAQASNVLEALSTYLSQEEESDLDAGGELSIAYAMPHDHEMHTVRIKLNSLAAASPAMVLGSRSGRLAFSASEEADEAEALDQAIAAASEGIHFLGTEDGPGAATVLRARVTGSVPFRRMVAEGCQDDIECRRKAGEDLFCRLAERAAPALVGPGDLEAAARGELCRLSGEASPEQVMLTAGAARTQLKTEATSSEIQAETLDLQDAKSGFEHLQAEEPWQSVDALARGMLRILDGGVQEEEDWPQRLSLRR